MMTCKTSTRVSLSPRSLYQRGDEALAAVISDLEVAGGGEGGGASGGLLGAPAPPQEGVPDEDSFLQSRVEMKSDVAAARRSQVDAETEGPQA